MIDHGFGVTLGPVEQWHNDMLRTWRNDYRIWRTCRQNDLISAPAQERWYERQTEDPNTKMYVVYVIEGPGAGDAVGVVGLTSIDLWNRRAEFSCYTGPEYQGRGLARAALKTLFTHGLYTLGLNSIWGETFDGNPAAVLFQKLGMMHEGIRRDHYYRDGKFLDAHLFSLLRSDWDRLFSAWKAECSESRIVYRPPCS